MWLVPGPNAIAADSLRLHPRTLDTGVDLVRPCAAPAFWLGAEPLVGRWGHRRSVV